MTDTASPGPVPPYVSFGTLLNQLERMEREGVPARIDGSYMTGMAGGTRSQFKVCLRSLGLIDDDSFATETLTRLAKDPNQRPELLASILRSRFPELAALNGNATRGQLEEIMAGYGLTNADTRRKAMGFFVAAATYAGLTLSPHLRPAGRIGSSSTQQRSRPTKKRSAPTPRAGHSGGPGQQSTPPADMRRAYFDLLLTQAQQAPDDKDLLDRIERLILASGETPQDRGGE
jgi:hypothetical protein